MKKLILSTLLIGGSLFSANATIHVVTISGFTFSPATVNATVGDTVAWVITGTHTATEVSNATWTADGSTPLPGFDFNAANTAAGTSWIQVAAVGTQYYVCTPHVASMSMKGRILIASGASINEKSNEISISIYPNPATETLNLNINNSSTPVILEIYNAIGTKVLDLGGNQILNNGIKQVDVSTLPRGVYFLNIIADNKIKSMRFVKK